MKTKSPAKRKPPVRGRKPPSLAPKPPSLKAKLVRIGNSRGVRLPKAVIEQAGLTDDIKVTVRGRQVVIEAADAPPRAGWEEQIKKVLAEYGDDIDEWREWQAMPNEFDEKEWTW